MLWAIEHLDSGLFMPEWRKGYTHIQVKDFVPLSGGDRDPPRLFVFKRSASLALSAWLKGSWFKIDNPDCDWLGGHGTKLIQETQDERMPHFFSVTEVVIHKSEDI